MAAAEVDVTEGSGTKIATHLINESGVDKHIQRMALNTELGEDVSVGSFITIDVSLVKSSGVTAYTANDAWAESTAAVGGSLFANASRGAGKSGIITDCEFFSSAAPATLLEGELWLFNSQVTAVADNAPFALSITDLKKRVARIPFTMEVAASGVSAASVDGVNKGFTTVGSANLYGLFKVKNAYIPITLEELTARVKIMRTN